MQYFEPNFLNEALVLLDRFGAQGRILAGGTRVGPMLRQGGLARDAAPAALINVKRIEELSTVAPCAGGLRIGALVTAARLRSHPLVLEHAPLLAEAASTMGARQLQTTATLGGSLCSGDAASDLSAALLACEARCDVAAPNEAVVSIPTSDLLERARAGLPPRELLVAVEIPSHDHRWSYQKMMRRRAFEMALVAVALRCRMAGDAVAQACIALAGAAPTPIRAAAAEAHLTGKRLDAGAAREAGRHAARHDATPDSDGRASAEYRRALVEVLVERAVLAAAQVRPAPPRASEGQA